MFSHILCFFPSLIADVVFLHRPIFQREIWPHNSPNLGSFGHSPLLRIHPPFWTCFIWSWFKLPPEVVSIMIRIIMFRSWFAQCIIWCKRPCLMWTLSLVSFVIRLIMFRSSENTALVNYHFQKRWIAHSLWRNKVFGSRKIKSHALPLSLFCNDPSPREFEMNTGNWTSMENCQSIFLREKTFAINDKLIKFFFYNLSKNVLFIK